MVETSAMQNYRQMTDELGKSLRMYLIYFAVLLLILMIVPDVFVMAANVKSSAQTFTSQENIVKLATLIVVPVFQTIIAFLGSFFVHLELHTILDKLSFNARRQTTQLLIQGLTPICQREQCSFVERIIGDPQKTMRHFYHLIDKMKPDLTQVFDRWARYYLNLYLLLFAVLLCFGCIVLRLTLLPFNRLYISSISFLLIAIIVVFNLVIQLLPRLKELARSSPSRLLTLGEDEVLNQMLSVCEVKRTLCPWAASKLPFTTNLI
jgi:hypothetical protein